MTIREIMFENKKVYYKILLSVIISILIIIISNIIIQPRIFNVNGIFNHFKVRITINIGLACFVFLGTFFILTFIEKLRNKDKYYKLWLINFCIYFVIMAIFLLLMWPGHWVWDEFWQLRTAVNLEIDTWQSYFTIIYRSICIMLIPFPAGIVIIQITILSTICSWVYTKIYTKYKNKIINFIFFIFMLTPAVIINNLYPLRLTMYSYILLLFMSILLFDWIEGKKLTVYKFLLISFLTFILMIWRSEGIIFLFIEPLLVSLVYKNVNKKILTVVALIILNIIIIKFNNIYLNILTRDAKKNEDTYSLTIFINPLSEMLQSDLKGKNIDEDLENIDKVLNIEVLKANPSYVEIPSFWNNTDELIRENWQENLGEFKKSYVKIIINNWQEFLKARIKTFLATSCCYEDNFAHIKGGSGLLSYYTDPNFSSDEINIFLHNYKFSKPINKDLKINVESFFMGKDFYTQTNNKAFILIFWNVIPILLVVLICFITSIFKKKYIFSLVFIALMTNFIIIFFTAPSNFFMYYVPFYICGTIISLIFIAQNIEDKNKIVNKKIKLLNSKGDVEKNER